MTLSSFRNIKIQDATLMGPYGSVSRSLSGIRSGLHELRVRDRAGQVRVIYYIKKEDAIYLIHGFRKKTRAIPQRELDIVNKRLKEI